MVMFLNLKDLRKQCQLSQMELAYECGVSLPTIQKIESGQSNPTWEVLQKITRTFGLEIRLEDAPIQVPLAIAYGVPLLGEEDPSIACNSRTLRLESRKWLRHWRSGKLSEREVLAFSAFYLAIRNHFPDFYQISIATPWLDQALKDQEKDGHVIKLYRIALTRLSQYL